LGECSEYLCKGRGKTEAFLYGSPQDKTMEFGGDRVIIIIPILGQTTNKKTFGKRIFTMVYFGGCGLTISWSGKIVDNVVGVMKQSKQVMTKAEPQYASVIMSAI